MEDGWGDQYMCGGFHDVFLSVSGSGSLVQRLSSRRIRGYGHVNK